MIVHDLDLFGPLVRPTEAEAELIVNTNAVLARAVPFQGFQSIARWNSQIVELARDLQLPQLASRHSCDIRESPDKRSFGKRLRIGTLKRLDHGIDSNASRDYWSRLASWHSKAASAICCWQVYCHARCLSSTPPDATQRARPVILLIIQG